MLGETAGKVDEVVEVVEMVRAADEVEFMASVFVHVVINMFDLRKT